MGLRGKVLRFAALSAWVPMMAACMPPSPQTQLSWGVNDRLSRQSAYAAPVRPVQRGVARTYVYRDNARTVPVPKPRPGYKAPAPVRQAAYHRDNVAAYSAVAFAWPVRGQVIAGFGASANGERNDGINIAVPMDAPIRAAASGTVTYSGNELKDYGNLLLIKHAGDYVTAYAHADRLLVQRGDFVAKGQVIGYAGRTGDVASPQLHFEIRHNTAPVDPGTLLASQSS